MRINPVLVSVIVFVIALGSPATGFAEDARGILETARQKQVERWEGVESYRVEQTTMGSQTTTWLERTEVTDDAGATQTLFMPVPGRQAGQCQGGAGLTSEGLDAYAEGLDMMGAGVGGEVERGMENAGLPKGLLGVGGGTIGTSMDPRVYTDGMADFARAGADAQRQEAGAADRAAGDARVSANHLAQFMDTAQLVGEESVDGRSAYHLRSEEINQVQPMEGGEFRMQTMSLWLDREQYVPLKMTMDGTMLEAGESRPITIESLQSDYRSVPGSRMYEPFKRVMTISGVMTPEREQQMREAQQQIQEMEQQLATMPADQRRMAEGMMGPRLEMMRSMAAGEGFRVETTVDQIVVNPPDPGAGGDPCPEADAQTVAAPASTGDAGAQPAGDTDPAALQAAQQACLQEKMEQAQAAQNTKRGFGRLMSGVSRAASRFGGGGLARDVAETTSDVYAANATAEDLSAAARDLGLTEDDIESCRNPQ